MNSQNRFEAFVEHPVVSAVVSFVLVVLMFALLGGRYFI